MGLPILLCHGDLWGNNLLYKRDADGTASNEVRAIVDWSETFLGNPMFDLAAYIVTGADAEVRREVDLFIVRFYLDELSRRLEEHGKTADFRVEPFEEAYKLASIVKTQEAVMNALFLAKPKKGEADDGVLEAKAAKLALRTKLMLEDAIRYLDEVAKLFGE
ncbi:Protein C04F6.7 [Aphelenchoides avenae]|nr:Protein C04F6.7 [Aphelenchus avenae]